MLFTDDTNHLSITRMTRGKLPSLPFARIKNAVLGKNYELSLVFPDRALATELHKEWKGKDDAANILSFPIDETTGEIFISLEQARRQAKQYNHTYEDHLAFLFIHGLAHLSGYAHGHAMEKFERSIRKRFSVPD